jgi:hypothetical protein
VYATQELMVRGTLAKIIDNLFEVENTQVDKRLIQLRIEFEEIIAQEQTLLNQLQPAIQKTGL